MKNPYEEHTDEEGFFDILFDLFGSDVQEGTLDKMGHWMWEQMGGAYAEGYKQGVADESQARDRHDQQIVGEEKTDGPHD